MLGTSESIFRYFTRRLSPDAVNVMAPIKDGAYHLDASQGPTKGKCRIEFSTPSALKQRVPNDDIPGQFMEAATETLPPRCHRDSKITLDYNPGAIGRPTA